VQRPKRESAGQTESWPCNECPSHRLLSRRSLLKSALCVGLISVVEQGVYAQTDSQKARPQVGDHLVFALGDRQGQLITLQDVPLDGPPVIAYPQDPTSQVVRNGSRLNRVLLVRLAPEMLTEHMRTIAADGIAIPSVRVPSILSTSESVLMLVFLAQPVTLTLQDPRQISTMFFLVCPTVHAHLAMLAKLAYCLADKDFHAAVARRAPGGHPPHRPRHRRAARHPGRPAHARVPRGAGAIRLAGRRPAARGRARVRLRGDARGPALGRLDRLRALAPDVLLIVNDRVDVALAVGAGGVQRTSVSLPVEDILREDRTYEGQMFNDMVHFD